MTLTFELIRAVIKLKLYTKFQVCRSNGSAVRVLNNRQMHRHTDGTDFIPSTADAGGNKS